MSLIKWFYLLAACAGSVLTPHDYIRSFLDRQIEHGEICSTAEATPGHFACVHAVLGGLKLADPGITTEPTGLTETQSRLVDLFTPAAVPGRSAALDVCVASPNAATARGDAARAVFDRQLSLYRHQGILYRLLVWTADGRPHPAVTRTAVCSGHRIQPQRPTDVGEITSAHGNTKSRSSFAAQGQP